MATLPFILPNGYVLVYGIGTIASTTGIVPNNDIFRFGAVSQVWAGGEVFVYAGTSVMFNENDVFCRLAYNNWPYTMIEAARLAGSEEPPPP